MCNIVHTCIKKYTVAVLYSCKFCTARVFLFLADHEAIQFTNILKIRRYLCADEAKGLLVPYVRTAVRRGSSRCTQGHSLFLAKGGEIQLQAKICCSCKYLY